MKKYSRLPYSFQKQANQKNIVKKTNFAQSCGKNSRKFWSQLCSRFFTDFTYFVK